MAAKILKPSSSGILPVGCVQRSASLGNKHFVFIPASKRDTCKFPPFLSWRRSSASDCGMARVMAVDGGLWGHNRLVLVMLTESQPITMEHECNAKN